jgi:3-deoxy-manno-octulosonate cytidylyltransferase (CMP-KDO synthetase)
MPPEADTERRLARIRLLALDVDGVLTDGTLYYTERGELVKGFHVRDGLGLKLLMQAGVHVAVLSGRSSGALARRVADLDVAHFFDGVDDKGPVIAALAGQLGVPLADVAFAADDVVDLPALRGVGLPIAVADAVAAVRAEAAWVTAAPGGRGAVREICDAILAARMAAGTGPAIAGESALPCRFHVVIPARHGAARLPGKPLRLLGGRPLVAHALGNATASGAETTLVATDDARIAAAAEQAGGRAVLTSRDHPSGTDRIAEVADREQWSDDAIVVNLQGDEPFIDGALIASLAQSLAARPHCGVATIATPIHDPRELFDPHIVKVVTDAARRALYFSRAPIPWVRDAWTREALVQADAVPRVLPPDAPFFRHLGIYAYRVATLRHLRDAKPHALEKAEMLEQLRALALGIAIHVEIIDRAPPPGVDTDQDLARAEAHLLEARA